VLSQCEVFLLLDAAYSLFGNQTPSPPGPPNNGLVPVGSFGWFCPLDPLVSRFSSAIVALLGCLGFLQVCSGISATQPPMFFSFFLFYRRYSVFLYPCLPRVVVTSSDPEAPPSEARTDSSSASRPLFDEGLLCFRGGPPGTLLEPPSLHIATGLGLLRPTLLPTPRSLFSSPRAVLCSLDDFIYSPLFFMEFSVLVPKFQVQGFRTHVNSRLTFTIGTRFDGNSLLTSFPSQLISLGSWHSSFTRQVLLRGSAPFLPDRVPMPERRLEPRGFSPFEWLLWFLVDL